ncbi:MAG: RNA methyltransferase [Candidatus Marsarchaeota archaeon]|nr:RNA methyltransferase [Candidatus Marsarchaeota archaeon]
MQNIKVVLVESRYQINLGYIARVAKNFGLKKLYLVNPKCRFAGANAIKYSKHAHELLENAVVCRSIPEATKGCFVVGTTGIWTKSGASFFNISDIDTAMKTMRGSKIKEICLLIGRDNIGLTKDELKDCDMAIFIPANPEYPVLNISHALAIILYALTKLNFKDKYGLNDLYAGQAQTGNTARLFEKFIAGNKQVRDKKAIAMVFRHILKRSNPTKNELKALNIAFHKHDW